MHLLFILTITLNVKAWSTQTKHTPSTKHPQVDGQTHTHTIKHHVFTRERLKQQRLRPHTHTTKKKHSLCSRIRAGCLWAGIFCTFLNWVFSTQTTSVCASNYAGLRSEIIMRRIAWIAINRTSAGEFAVRGKDPHPLHPAHIRHNWVYPVQTICWACFIVGWIFFEIELSVFRLSDLFTLHPLTQLSEWTSFQRISIDHLFYRFQRIHQCFANVTIVSIEKQPAIRFLVLRSLQWITGCLCGHKLPI